MKIRQGLAASRGLIGAWPDESELGARPSLLAPAEPLARPLPVAALSRVTAAEVAGRSRREAETRRPKTWRSRGGTHRARPHAQARGHCAGTYARSLARTGQQVSRRCRARCRWPRTTDPAAPEAAVCASRTPSRSVM